VLSQNPSINTVQKLFAKSSDGSLIVKNGVYIDCNDAALILTGYPDKATLLNIKPGGLSPPTQPDGRASSDKVSELLQNAFETNEATNFKWTLLRYDNITVEVDVSVTPFIIGDEQYVQFLWHDSSGYALKRKTESVNQLIEQMGDAHLVLKDGIYIECNQAAADLLGYPDKQSVLNLGRENFYPEYQPDGARSQDKAIEHIEKTRQEGSFAFEWTYKKFDGSLLPTILTMTFSIVDGEEILHIIWRDISTQKEAHSDSIKELITKIGDATLLIKDDVFIDCNQVAVDLLGYPDKETLLATPHDEMSPPLQPDGQDSSQKATELITAAYKKRSDYFDWVHIKYDGSLILLEALLTPVTINNEILVHVIWRDITDIRNQQVDLEESEKKYKTLFEDSGDAMLLIDDQKFIDCNDTSVEMLGYTSKEPLLNVHPAELSPPTQPDGRGSFEKANELIGIAFKQGHHRFEWSHQRKNGDIFPVEILLTLITIKGKQVLHTVWRDLTDKKADEAKIKKLAYEDTLTGLPNRRTLVKRLIRILETYKRTNSRGALLFIDLDHFKHINDTLGHSSGDDLLQQVAKRLADTLRTCDTVARFGGDEFVIMLEGLGGDFVHAANAAEKICEKLLFNLNKPYNLNGKERQTSASIGVSMFTKDSIVSILLQQSDIAMYQAKAAGRNKVRFFDPKMQQAVDERANIEELIKDSLASKLFELHYQLQVETNGNPLGVEALLRLKHPEKGFIPPMHYIPVAEDTGLILHIGNFVLETACQQLKLWESNSNTKTLSIAINVSPLEFKADSFVMNVLCAIENHDINPSLLKLELTETMMVDDIDDIIAKMNILKENSVRFSMDDFGTGYSSLQYLRQLPLDQLKIDQSFVRDLEYDDQDRSIIKTIIAMGNGLGLDVIAEGVENKQQQEMLREYGCSHYQGYLFAKPLPIDELEKQL